LWAKIGKIVRKNINNIPKVLSAAYKTIVLSVLLYGAETWVTSTTIMSTWEYPSSLETHKKANLLTISQYITKRKRTVSGYVQSTQFLMTVSTLFLPLQKPNPQSGGQTKHYIKRRMTSMTKIPNIGSS
jgi:hypothetical protein